MKTFLVLMFCLLVVDHGDAVLEMGLEKTGVELGASLDLLPIDDSYIVIMQRLNGSLNFNRNWEGYKNGFGKLGRGEFWLGNEIVHRLTNKLGDVYSLRIEVYTEGAWFYAHYANFSLDSEDNKYAILVSGFSGGTAGDSLTNTSVASYWYHGGMRFSTPDADNDAAPVKNCAREYLVGWWFNGCWHSCFTCKYWKDFQWESLSYLKSKGILQGARMMIKRQMNKP